MHFDPAANHKPILRLVRGPGQARQQAQPEESPIGPALAAGDPRWVLAVRVADALEGSVLRPDKREKLIRLGRGFGLTTFDVNLIIAIVQDQARHGHSPAYCPRHAEPLLRMVAPSRRTSVLDTFRGRRGLITAAILAAIVALELALIAILL